MNPTLPLFLIRNSDQKLSLFLSLVELADAIRPSDLTSYSIFDAAGRTIAFEYYETDLVFTGMGSGVNAEFRQILANCLAVCDLTNSSKLEELVSLAVARFPPQDLRMTFHY